MKYNFLNLINSVNIVTLLVTTSCKKTDTDVANEKITHQLQNSTGHNFVITYFGRPYNAVSGVTVGYSASLNKDTLVSKSQNGIAAEYGPYLPTNNFKGDSVFLRFDDGKVLNIACQEPTGACIDTLSPVFLNNYDKLQDTKQEAIFRFTFWPEHYNRAR